MACWDGVWILLNGGAEGRGRRWHEGRGAGDGIGVVAGQGQRSGGRNRSGEALQRSSGRGAATVIAMRGCGAGRSFARSDVDIKRWLEAPTFVDAIRPGRCSGCSGAGSPPGLPRGPHGHGLRERQFRGPSSPGAPPTIVVLSVRRYRCQGCGTVMTVVSRETAAWRLYTVSAMAWALPSVDTQSRPRMDTAKPAS